MTNKRGVLIFVPDVKGKTTIDIIRLALAEYTRITERKATVCQIKNTCPDALNLGASGVDGVTVQPVRTLQFNHVLCGEWEAK
jgi:hypothetical protein